MMAIVGVGSLEDFVQQEKNPSLRFNSLHDHFDPQQFGIKAGYVFLQIVGNPHAGAYIHHRTGEGLCAYRCAGISQNKVQADGS